MPKISALPPATVLDGNETVVMLKDGLTRRGPIGSLVGAAVAPAVLAVEAARDATLSAAVSSGYRPTLADAVADFDVGTFFTCDDQDEASSHPNELRLYRRIATAPFWEDQGDEAAPVGRSLLRRPEAAAGLGFQQRGANALPETLEDIARRLPFSGQYTSAQDAFDAQLAEGDRLLLDSGATGPIEIKSRNVILQGKGIGATVVRPETDDGVALRYSSTEGSWRPAVICDMQIEGIGTLEGEGFRTGPDSYGANAEYVGRSII